MTYQPVFEVRDRSRYYKSPGVILPFELGYRAHVMQIQSKAYVDYVRFEND